MKNKQLEQLAPSETIDMLQDYYFAPYITLAHLFNAPKGWHLKPRTLSQFQFQYVVDGIAEYRIEDRIYETKRGDLTYHRPNELHSVTTIGDQPYICMSIVFHFGNSTFPLSGLIGSDHHIGNFTDHPIEQKLSQLVSHYHQPGLHHQVICQGLLLQIVSDITSWKTKSQLQSKAQEKNKAKLVLIRNYIAKHYNKQIKHQDLEQISGLSRNYIIVQFKKAFGVTPFEYLTRVRIERAKEFVVQTNLSIGEIAHLVGYSDVHTFGRMFKNKTGTSLSQFSSSIVVN